MAVSGVHYEVPWPVPATAAASALFLNLFMTKLPKPKNVQPIRPIVNPKNENVKPVINFSDSLPICVSGRDLNNCRASFN